MGGLFGGNSGVCSSEFQGGRIADSRFCNKILKLKTKSCTEQRTVTVDRKDAWICQEENSDYKGSCTSSVGQSCNWQDGGSCLRHKVQVSGAFPIPSMNPQWNQSGSYVSWGLWPHHTSYSLCTVSHHRYTVTVNDLTELNQFHLSHITGFPFGQIKANGHVIATIANGAIRNDLHGGLWESSGNVYVGGAHVGYCSVGNNVNAWTSIDLRSFLQKQDVYLNSSLGSQYVGGWAKSGQVTLDLHTISYWAPLPFFGLSVSGRCCSHLNPVYNAACPPANPNDVCTSTGTACTQTGNTTLAGFNIRGGCRSTVTNTLCKRAEPLGDCRVLKQYEEPGTGEPSRGKCRVRETECIQVDGGECSKTSKIYDCLNGPIEADPATLIDRQFVNFQEVITNDCGDLTGCTVTSSTDVEGGATKTINGLDVTRVWWERDKEYSCKNPDFEDSCGPLEADQLCTQANETCLAWDDETGECSYAEREFQCKGDGSFTTSCEPINACIGENCTTVEQEPSPDFAKSAAWLNVLDRMAKDAACEADTGSVPSWFLSASNATCKDGSIPTVELFKGTARYCGYNGIASCCNDDGWDDCQPTEIALRGHKASGTAVYTGSRCAERTWYGLCIWRKKHYCTYDSKMAMVFQREVNKQTGAQFSQEACPGLSIYDLEQLDFDQIDLTDLFGHVSGNVENLVAEELQDRLSTRMGVFELDVKNNLQ